MVGQPRSEDIRDVDELGFITDRARARHLGTDLARRASKFGVGIAHIGSIKVAKAIVRENRCPRQPIVDVAGRCLGFHRWRTENHMRIVGRPEHPCRANRRVGTVEPGRLSRSTRRRDRHHHNSVRCATEALRLFIHDGSHSTTGQRRGPMTSPISANALLRDLQTERALSRHERRTMLMRLVDLHVTRREAARKRRARLAEEESRLAIELRPHARVGRLSA